jgi:monoamine oxidase
MAFKGSSLEGAAMVQPGGGGEPLDLAVIGAGAAGTWIAHAVMEARADWSVAIFERSSRVGGRLWSVRVPGIAQPIELGGMRYLTSHPMVDATVNALGLPTRVWDTQGGPERSYLRGVWGNGPADPASGRGYQVAEGERDRSAADLTRAAFLSLVPEAEALDTESWSRVRATHRFRDRPLTDWRVGDAIATVLSPEGHQLAKDAFGYYSGANRFNAGDVIEYMTGSGHPVGEARVPLDGMDSIPRALASAFVARGGLVHLEQELHGCDVADGLVRLRLGDGVVTARRAVLTVALPALRSLARQSSVLDTSAWRRVLPSVEDFAATKLYLWYERPWWREGDDGPAGIRMTTDLPNRKVFYFDERSDGPAAMLASYTDGLHTDPWVELAGGVSNGGPAPAAMLERIHELLRAMHPLVADVPEPAGSAFMHWGSDPHETGWTFWSAGHRSDAIMTLAPQPEPGVPIYVAGDAFSRAQAWVEGAFETADRVVQRVLQEPR